MVTSREALAELLHRAVMYGKKLPTGAQRDAWIDSVLQEHPDPVAVFEQVRNPKVIERPDFVMPDTETPTDDELRDAVDHIEGAVDFQDAINPEAVRVLVAAARRTVQGEPTDAQVTAAMAAYEGHPTRVEAWRAALRAAAQAGEVK